MTISEDSGTQQKHDNAEAESLRLSQEQQQAVEAEASFRETYSAIIKLFNVKQKKYKSTLELALLEGKISLKAMAVFGILMLAAFVIVAVLWGIFNVALVLGVMHCSSSVWLGLMVAAGVNVLLFFICFNLMKKVKREVGFNRTQRVFKGDL